MSFDEFERISELEWLRVKVEGTPPFSWMANFPADLGYEVYASGSNQPNATHSSPLIPSGQVIGGIDVYRKYPDDPVNYNKDCYAVILDPNNEEWLYIKGPVKDYQHWTDDLPEHITVMTFNVSGTLPPDTGSQASD